MSHRQIFSNFLNDLNKNQVRYVILRGFARLPKSPDSDIDLACYHEDWNKFNEIAPKHLSKDPKEPFENYGFAEYSDMLYHPYFTPGKKDRSISNGCFRVDSYNCIYFSSPFKNFKGFWTIPHALNESVFTERVSLKNSDYTFYIPKPEHELTLLVLRSVLDVMGWKRKRCKDKHKNRIKNLLPACDRAILKEEISKVLPVNDFVMTCIEKVELEKLYNKIIGEFNNGVNRR